MTYSSPRSSRPNGIDIGRRLVLAGWALAYRRYSRDYIGAEDEARKAKRGMWRGSFVKLSIGTESGPRIGVRPWGRTGSGGCFDRLPGVVVLELGGAQIAKG